MPRQTDYSDRSKTLPRPELNPTLNPVLGQNMGRWAEVYFTSPPEKREEAVLELLRTLEAESPTPEEGRGAPPLVAEHVPAQRDSSESQVATEVSKLVECHLCGRINPAQRFCGMCGARLNAATEPDSQIKETPQIVPGPSAQNWESQLFPEEQTVESPMTGNESPLFGSNRERTGSDHIPNRFLPYIGGALAILIMAVVYIAWRGAQATSRTSQLAPPAPSEVTTQPAVQGSSSSKFAPPESSLNATPPASQNAGTRTGGAEKTIPSATIAKNADTNTPQGPAISGGGFDELATARSYLNGTDGHQHDTAEAVDWLWKAVAKRNTEATLLLSNLFLKGNGLPQNCDQGRVLLDAAASRGSKDAAERLRHLQAFGCK